jgi:integration host factor subunit alpha
MRALYIRAARTFVVGRAASDYNRSNWYCARSGDRPRDTLVLQAVSEMTRNTVKRADLCNAVYQKTGLSRAESATLVELVLKEIADCLERGETVKLSSFGFFVVRHKRQRVGRNPKTGKAVPILPRRVLVFKASEILKKRINAATGSADQVQLPRLSDMMKHR